MTTPHRTQDTENDRLKRELAAAKAAIDQHRRRADLAEASAQQAWRMAAWGGARRRADAADHVEP